MAKLSSASPDIVKALFDEISTKIERSAYFEDAAQLLIDRVYSQFVDSIVMARVFVTVPFQALPEPNRSWVSNLAQSKGVAAELTPATQVISLAGSAGEQADWNGRRQAKDVVGIPLVSASFIDKIPLMARLLSAMGRDLSWIDKKESSAVVKTLGNVSGFCYVADAKTDKDGQGRRIISDELVAHGVVSVCGIGIGNLLANGTLIVLLIFAREKVSEQVFRGFQSLALRLKASTSNLLEAGKIFSP